MRKNEAVTTNQKETKGLSRLKRTAAAVCGAGYMVLNAMPMTVLRQAVIPVPLHSLLIT